jgi:hypothetical protein
VKIYVAGGAQERETVVQPMMKRLREAGFVITLDWTESEGFRIGLGDDKLSPLQREMQALEDLDGVDQAEVVWLMVPGYRGSRGSYLEFGYALALWRRMPRFANGCRLPILVVSGESWKGTIFTELADMKFDDHEQAFEMLCRLKKASLNAKEESVMGTVKISEKVYNNINEAGLGKFARKTADTVAPYEAEEFILDVLDAMPAAHKHALKYVAAQNFVWAAYGASRRDSDPKKVVLEAAKEAARGAEEAAAAFGHYLNLSESGRVMFMAMVSGGKG